MQGNCAILPSIFAKESSMKFALMLAVALFFASCQTTDYTSDMEAIREVMTASEAAWNSGDLEAFMTSYARSDSVRFIGSRGVSYGYDTVLTNYQASYPDRSAMGSLEYTDLDIELFAPDVALVVGQWRLYRDTDEPHGWYTLLFRKIDSRWLIVHDHSSGVGG
jgi:uncharacterized protein (TIGR02246 family)